MWQNLVRSQEYVVFFKSHKEQLLTKELKAVLQRGLASIDLQKIVYGRLLEDNELYSI